MQVYSGAHGRTMIFTATKNDANELCMNNILKQVCLIVSCVPSNKLIQQAPTSWFKHRMRKPCTAMWPKTSVKSF